MNHVGQIATIVKNHVQGLSIGEAGDRLLDTPAILLLSLSLPSENGNTRSSNAVCMICELIKLG